MVDEAEVCLSVKHCLSCCTRLPVHGWQAGLGVGEEKGQSSCRVNAGVLGTGQVVDIR